MTREELVVLIADAIVRVNRPGDARTEGEQIVKALEKKVILLERESLDGQTGIHMEVGRIGSAFRAIQ
jgi:hypothetical protein